MNPYLTHKRIGMFEDMIEVCSILFEYATLPKYKGLNPFDAHPELSSRINQAQVSFQLYGHLDENEALKALVCSLIPKPDVKKFHTAFSILLPLLRDRFREEVGLEPIEPVQQVPSKNVVKFKPRLSA